VTEGRLVVCATPIGNLGDVSDRLRATLEAADLLYAEDTRRAAKLLSHLGTSIPVLSLFVGNEIGRSQEIVEAVASGSRVAIVSDAGMPTISDPGAHAVRAVREAGFRVEVIPGPSAVTTALAHAGFGGDRFVFEGFLPRKGNDRTSRLRAVGAETRPVVLFASPNRLSDDLTDLVTVCGPGREVAVTRELTKLHEESWVGSLAEAVSRWSGEIKGEVTLVLGPTPEPEPSLDEAIAKARELVDSGESVSAAARQVSADTGVSRHQIYEALISSET
jgi:16S rRNA (cytidine1402-2'-O)-methyltransferase